MEEYLALATGLQFGYWFWNATVQPGMTRLSEDVGATLGEVAKERIYQWFKIKVQPQGAQTSQPLDENPDTQKALVEEAQREMRLQEHDVNQFMDTTIRQVKQLLRNPDKYTLSDLEKFWQDYGDHKVPFAVLVAKNAIANPQTGIADELVMYTITRNRFPQLIAAMRQPRF